jgi:hypothetical protein
MISSVDYCRKSFLFISLAIIFLVATSFNTNSQPEKALELLNTLKTKTLDLKTIQTNIILKERIKGEYNSHKSSFKIQISPFKLYMKEEFPRQGLEVLYVDGQNNGKAWVKPNSFPWTTISLNPLGNTMRSEQHHSLFKSGFTFFIQVIGHLLEKYKTSISGMVEYNGLVKYNNTICYKLTFTNTNFKYVNYTVQPGENLEKLSYKLYVNDYMIKELNPDIEDFETLKAGKVIKVPNDYGSSFNIYIDLKTNLLVGAKVFDDKGLWEEYSYSETKVNPQLTSMDFDIKNPSYNF